MIQDLQVVGIQRYVNFKNFLNSFVTLFRISTGEDWHLIMFDMTRTKKDGCMDNVSCGHRTILT